MMKRRIIVAAVLAAFATASYADCLSCSPQCVPAARAYSGLDFPRVQYAQDIPAAVRADKTKKFKISSTPRDKSVVAVKLGKVGHAMAVVDSKKDGKKYKLRLAHSNADCKCTAETVSGTYDPASRQITMLSGILKGKKLSVIDGFVVKA
jgi:hypothetical protein